MRQIKIILVFLFIAVVFVSFFLLYQIEETTNEHRFVKIGNARIKVEIADTDNLREKGLSLRESIGKDEGMIFLFQNKGMHGFWMKDMKFPIDIIWISDGYVLGIEKNIDPQLGNRTQDLRVYYPPREVDMVLEIGMGESDRLSIREGDSVSISL